MPHSVSPPSESPPDAPEQTMTDAQTTGPSDDAQNTGNDADDVTMAEPEEVPQTINKTITQEEEEKVEVKLEDLFVDVDSDDDDEFVRSRPGGNKPSSPAAAPAPSSPLGGGGGGGRGGGTASLRSSDPELMRTFYQRLFPWRYLFQWLNHGPTPTNDFGHREFAFTMPNDQYWRYQSYPTADLLRKDVLRHMPTRFEIGPVYSANPRDRKTMRQNASFRPVAKELCFDIDLTDYDDVRTCCDKANICRRCWAFITMAIKVVDAALRDDFGFRHVLWVYSGRRGAHAWVCDKKARALNDQKRRAIAGYLDVVRGGAQAGKRVNVRRPLHPHLSRSLDILAPYFQTTVLETQDPWADPDPDPDRSDYEDDVDDHRPAPESASRRPRPGPERLLSLLPDRALNAALRSKWESSPGRASALKWADIDAVARSGASRHLDGRALLEAKQDVVLEHTYPRLDIEVSKKLNHLLKSPFVVHPGTGRVCVPIDTRPRPADGDGEEDPVDAFDPLAVPTVQQLVAEIDAWRGGDDEDGSGGGGGGGGGGGDDDGDGVDGDEVGDGAKVKVKKEESEDVSLEALPGASRRGRRNLHDWEKTSLRPHIEYFRSFVLALMRDEREDGGGGGARGGPPRLKRERDHEAEAMEF